MFRRTIFAGMIGALSLMSSAHAQEEKDAGMQLLEDFLENVQTISGRFEQQLLDADNNVIEESAGTLDIRRPGQFRWAYAEPYEQLLIADGVNMWSYDVDLEQVTVKVQDEALGSTPALLLGGSTDVLDDFDYVGSFADRGTQWVLLRPKNTENGFYKVELGFTDGQLSRMLFGDNLEQTTLIALIEVDFNEPIDGNVFAFVPPEGVDVVGEPVAGQTLDP